VKGSSLLFRKRDFEVGEGLSGGGKRECDRKEKGRERELHHARFTEAP